MMNLHLARELQRAAGTDRRRFADRWRAARGAR